jgi:hypothetical protein
MPNAHVRFHVDAGAGDCEKRVLVELKFELRRFAGRRLSASVLGEGVLDPCSTQWEHRANAYDCLRGQCPRHYSLLLGVRAQIHPCTFQSMLSWSTITAILGRHLPQGCGVPQGNGPHLRTRQRQGLAGYLPSGPLDYIVKVTTKGTAKRSGTSRHRHDELDALGLGLGQGQARANRESASEREGCQDGA